MAGFSFIWNDGFLRPVVVQVALHNVALGALSLIVVVGSYERGVPSALIGGFVAAQAAGALVGSLITARLLRRLRAGRVMLLTGSVWVVLVPAAATAQHPAVVIALLTVLWLLAPVQRTVIGTCRGQRVPEGLLGRVTAASVVLTGSLAALGPWLGGVLLERQTNAVVALALLVILAPPVLASAFVSRIGRTTVDVAGRRPPP